MAPITTEQVWQQLTQNLFGVLGMVTPKGEARTAGIVYLVRERVIYITTGRSSWKAKHIAQNPHVSLTVTIPRRIPLLPWIKIPAATITLNGHATVTPAAEVPPDLLAALFRQAAQDKALVADSCVITLHPQGDFVTYGVGVPLMQMRDPKLARGRAPVTQSVA